MFPLQQSKLRFYSKQKMKNDPTEKSLNKKDQEQIKSAQFNVPVTYIWYGPEVPQDYMIRLSNLPYPVRFLKDPPISRSFNRQLKLIQKADYYRLQHIYENGGIYSDFDNKIDYKCMGQVLANYKQSQKVIFWWQPKRNFQTRNVVPNNFIYAPKPKMQSMDKILHYVNEQNRDLKFAGMQYLAQFANKQLIQVKQLYNCIQHYYDFSWVRESGKTGGNRGDKQQLADKKRKKAEIVTELENLKKQNVQMKREYDILMYKHKETEEKLMKEYKKNYVSDGIQEKGVKKQSNQLILNKQITQQELIQNIKLASLSENKSKSQKKVADHTKNLEPPATIITQNQNAKENKQQHETSKQTFQSQAKYSGEVINMPPPDLYQPSAQSSSPVYAGQGMKFVDYQKYMKNLNINHQISSYKIDDSLMLVLVFTVIGLVLLFILGFIWSKVKQHRKYAEVNLRMERKMESQRKFRVLQKQQLQRRDQDQLNSQRNMNEENEVFSLRQ